MCFDSICLTSLSTMISSFANDVFLDKILVFLVLCMKSITLNVHTIVSCTIGWILAWPIPWVLSIVLCEAKTAADASISS